MQDKKANKKRSGMRRYRKLFFLLVCMFILSAKVSVAEETKMDNRAEETGFIELGEIVVTPSRQEGFLKDASSKVTVISGKEVKQTGAQTIEEVFRNMPELSVVGDSVYQTMKRQITLRGVPDQSRTLVMIDGVPLNTAWQGRVEWGIVPPECIERIEVVHGPMSTLYGSGAMGGVINIITEFPEKPNQTIFNSKYGSLNSWSTVFLQGGRFEKFAYYLGGRFFQTNGYIPENNPDPYSVRRDRKDIASLTKLAYFLDENSRLVLGFLHNEEDICRGRQFFNIDDEANLGYLSYNSSLGDMRLKGTLFINDQDWKREFDKGPNYNYLDMIENIDHTYMGAMLEVSLFMAKGSTLTTGIDYKHGQIHLQDGYQLISRHAEARGQQHLVSVFLQQEMKLLDEKLIATLGMRGDYAKSYKGWCYDTGQVPQIDPISRNYNSRHWTELSPKASLLYHLKDSTDLRLSFGRAFNAPDLKQLYMVLARPTKTIYGNADLDPETLNSYEFGVNHRFSEKFILGLNFYYSQGDDFISTRTISANTFKNDNINEVRIWGIEEELKYRINKQWSWSGSYTFNKSIIDEDVGDPTLNGNDLSLQPRHQVSSKITYENPRLFTLSAVLRYVSRMYSDLENTDELNGYCNLDLQMSKKLNENIELSLSCQNLFDKEYDVPNMASEDLQAPGRIFIASLTIRW